MYGAGGGASYCGNGGSGAGLSGFLPVVSSEALRIIVGRGGVAVTAGTDADGSGGAGKSWNALVCASGGGRSAIQRLTGGSWQDIVTAGAGGAGGCFYCYAGGKAAVYNQSDCYGETAVATTLCCGANAGCGGGAYLDGPGEGCPKGGAAAPGARLYGGNATSSYGGGGGGGGYYGGGAGAGGGGGGGSTYFPTLSGVTGYQAIANEWDPPNLALPAIGTGAVRPTGNSGAVIPGSHGMVFLMTLVPSVSPSASMSSSTSVSASRSPSTSTTVTMTGSSSPSITSSPSSTRSMSSTPSVTPSVTMSVTPSVTASASLSPSISASTTPSVSVTSTITRTVTPSVTMSPSASASVSGTLTPSFTRTTSETGSVTSSWTPSKSQTVSPSVSGSVTVTPSNSGSWTATTSMTATVTRTASVTASTSATATLTSTVTVTSSMTASITPSPTPALFITGLTVTAVDMYSSDGMPTSVTAAATNVLIYVTIQGSALAALCVDTNATLRSWTAAVVVDVFTCNDAEITVSVVATADPAPFLYTGATVTVLVPGWHTVTATLTPAQTRLTTNVTAGSALPWGSFIAVSGPLLASAGVTSIPLFFVYPSDPGGANGTLHVPCFGLVTQAPDTLVCQLRHVFGTYPGAAPLLSLSLVAPRSGVAATFTAALDFPTSAHISAAMARIPLPGNITLDTSGLRSGMSFPSDYLPHAGGATLTMRLPQGAWMSSECLALFNDTAVVLSVGDANLACTVDESVPNVSPVVTCPSSSGHGSFTGATLAMCGALVFTLPVTTYEPPSVLSLSPSYLVWPQVKDVIITIDTAQDATTVAANLQLLNASCASTTVSGAVITCARWSTAQAAVAPDLDYISLTVSYLWHRGIATSTVELAPVVIRQVISSSILVIRPSVSSVNPSNVVPGSSIILVGEHFCPTSGCTPGDNASTVLVNVRGAGPADVFPCTPVQVFTATVAMCTPPYISSDTAGFPTFTVTLANGFGALASYMPQVTYPSSGFVLAIGPVPSTFMPSDPSAPMRLSEALTFGIKAHVDTPMYDGPISCTLSTRTAAVLLVPLNIPILADVTNVSVVDFGPILIQATFEVAEVLLSVACTSADDTLNSVLAFTWAVRPLGLRVTACINLPVSAPSQAILSPYPVLAFGLVAAPPDALQSAVACAAPYHSDLPSITCTAAATGAGEAVLQGNLADVNRTSGIASFPRFSLGGIIGSTYVVSLRCTIGSVSIPPTITWTLNVTGCSPGNEPSGSVCRSCNTGHYSDGGIMACTSCPSVGADCSGGILALQPGYFRPPTQIGRILDGSAELHVCGLPEACLLNMSTRDYSCAAGYIGPLCGLCDVAADYALLGNQCLPCLSSSENTVIVVLCGLMALFAFAAAVLWKARNQQRDQEEQRRALTKSGKSTVSLIAGNPLHGFAATVFTPEKKVKDTRNRSSIALRMLLSHTQAVGTLKTFTQGGSAMYRSIMSWTDVLSPAVLSQGPLQCSVKPDFLTTFVATLMAPVLASALAVFMLVAAAAGGILFMELQKDERNAKPGLSGSRNGDSCSSAIVYNNEGNNSMESKGGSHGISRMSRLVTAIREQWKTRRHVAILLFVCHIAYMPITSVCVSVFNCTTPIGGVRYLASDLRVSCTDPQYLVAAIMAAIVLALFSLGFPILLYLKFSRTPSHVLRSEEFQAVWGFLYHGYKIGQEAGKAEGIINRTATPKARVVVNGNDTQAVPTKHAQQQRASPKRVMLPPLPTDSGAPSMHSTVPMPGNTLVNPMVSASLIPAIQPVSPDDTSGATDGGAATSVAIARMRRMSLVRAMTAERQSLPWWESVVLLRKAVLVLIGVLLSNPVGQAVAVVVFFTLLIVAHTRMLPYTSHMFNVVEGASMLCVIVTAALGLLSSVSQTTTTVLVATVFMLAINFAMLYILLHVLLKEHLATLCSNSRVAAAIARLRTKPLSSCPPPTEKVRNASLLDKRNERTSAAEQGSVEMQAGNEQKGLPTPVRPKLVTADPPNEASLGSSKLGSVAMDRRLAPLQSRASQRFIRPVRPSLTAGTPANTNV